MSYTISEIGGAGWNSYEAMVVKEEGATEGEG